MRKTPLQAQRAVEEWNEAHEVGAAVLFRPFVGFDGMRVERTRSPAAVLWQRLPVVWITNHLGAMSLHHLQPLTEEETRQRERPLLRARNCFGLMLHKNPGVGHDGRPFHIVAGEAFHPHAPHLTVLLLEVLKGQDHVTPLMEAESVQQLTNVLRLHQTTNVMLLLRIYTELLGQLAWSLKFSHFRHRPRRWRGPL